MPIPLSECERVVREVQPALTGGWIQKIHQPQSSALTLDVRQPGETLRLFISVEPRFARLHLSSRKYDNPFTPPPFCLFLRSHLEGGRVESIVQVPGDRIVAMTIVTHEAHYLLVIALTGQYSNVFVLDKNGMILRSLRPSHQQPGTPYVPPKAHPEMRITDSEVLGYDPISEQPVEPFSTESHHSSDFGIRFPISAHIEQLYNEKEAAAVRHRQRSQTLAQLRKTLKRTKKRIAALEQDFAAVARYQEYGRYGELLKGSLHMIKPGDETVTVIDYYDPQLPELTLPLDPAKNPTANLDEYFRKYQKYVSAERHLRPRLEAAIQEAARLEQALEQADIPETVRMIREESKCGSSPHGSLRQKPVAPKARGYREFRSRDGLPILVGKTAADNDALTFNIAAPDDLWLHARGVPGSHVVVRLPKAHTVPPATLHDAATLALWYSDLRKSGKGEVLYTKKKFVKKAKGHKPGAVHISREKTLWITIDRGKLECLKHGLAIEEHR